MPKHAALPKPQPTRKKTGRTAALNRNIRPSGDTSSAINAMQAAKGWRADFAKLFENTADGVWVSGPDGRILFWNRAAENMLGYRAKEVIGEFCRVVFDGSDSSGNQICRWPCPIKMRLAEKETVQHFDMATRTKTGRPLWINISCLSLPAPDGRTSLTVHLFRDVTEAHEIGTLVRQRLAEARLTSTEPGLTPAADLTRRELQILSLLQAGATTAAIAQQLFVARATVKNHVQNIFSKLEVHSRLEAVAYVKRLSQRSSASGSET